MRGFRRLDYGLLHRLLFTLLVAAPLIAAAALPGPFAPSADQSALPARMGEVARALAAGHLPLESVSYVIADVDSGRVIESRNADMPRSPGSTLKIVTTLASLDTLGPAFTWTTRALADGPIAGGVLHGNLYLEGGGDPYMTIERWWYFVQELRATGLRTLTGDIVVDDHGFALADENPAAFDGHPNRPYNVIPDAMLVNFQTIDFRIAPDARARRVDVAANPAPFNLHVDNRIRLVGGRCRGRGNRVDFEVFAPRRDRVLLTGTLSKKCPPAEIARAVMRAPAFAAGTFVPLWRQAGGRFTGKVRVATAPSAARELLSFDSLTLGEIVRLTNKYSNNVMARDLLLTMGERRFGAPATVDKGIAAVQEWSRACGLDLHGAQIDNGAGLSRIARISAATLAEVLRYAYHSRYAPEFIASLPIAGVDGTLRTSMRDTPPGAVRLKTGHIDEVSAVAGYVTTSRGHTYVLVSVVNDPRVAGGVAEPVHAALVDWILRSL